MKNLRSVFLLVLTVFIFWFLKFYIGFPAADVSFVGVVLTIASILFGFLASFFISELWTRYTEIRTLQSIRSTEGLNMIQYASNFFKNKEFEIEFRKLVEKTAIVDETVEWDEVQLEIPFHREIEKSFRLVQIENRKQEVYFEKLLDSYNAFVEAIVRLDTLGKEKLFTSEWITLILLSSMIALSILFLDITHVFYQIIVLAFPAVLFLAINLIYNLNTLSWSKEAISLEPNARLFDALDVSRFYLKKKRKFISPSIKNYRTEDDLTGELKEIYSSIQAQRKTISSGRS